MIPVSIARALLPETCLVAGALGILAVDLAALKGRPKALRLQLASLVGLAAIAAACLGAVAAGCSGPAAAGAVTLDALTLSTRLGILLLAALTVGIGSGETREQNPAEFTAVILFATAGLSLMAAASQLLVAFLALELASLSLYILAGFDKRSPDSAEAGLKYFLSGAMSAAFLLFGFSLIYGISGSIDFAEISRFLAHQFPCPSPLLAVALVLVLVGFGFKAAAAPFHLWAPDVYQGAPAPSAALVASASKLGGVVLFWRLLWSGLGGVAGNPHSAALAPGWMPVLAAIAAASLLVGNLGALAQTSVRRLLGYSAIGHAGVLLLGVIAACTAGPAPLFYYAVTYGLATVGAFGVIAVVDRAGGGCRSIADLAGLHRRSPLLAGCLLVFILSLAGIPPLAGFFGKFFIFTAALEMNGLGGPAGWLAMLALALSAVALYYYLIVLKQAVIAPPAEGRGPIRTDPVTALTLLCAAFLVVILGVFPTIPLCLF